MEPVRHLQHSNIQTQNNIQIHFHFNFQSKEMTKESEREEGNKRFMTVRVFLFK